PDDAARVGALRPRRHRRPPVGGGVGFDALHGDHRGPELGARALAGAERQRDPVVAEVLGPVGEGAGGTHATLEVVLAGAEADVALRRVVEVGAAGLDAGLVDHLLPLGLPLVG